MTDKAVVYTERFWSRVKKTDTCWLWIGHKSDRGYGLIGCYGKNVPTHRFSWTLHKGPIPDDLWVLHKCDVRNCVNPDHLFLGNNLDNMRDAAAKDRFTRKHRTHCPKGHPYDAENTIMKTAASGNPAKACRACANDYARRYKIRLKSEGRL